MRAIVLQSTPPGRRPVWLDACLASVHAWAEGAGHAYRLIGDELFAPVPAEIAAIARYHKSTLADLGRLAWIERLLAEGWERVVWLDADVLVVAPARLRLTPGPEGYLLGREVWVQPGRGGKGVRAVRNLHNAGMAFCPGNPFLAFYRHAAERIVARLKPEAFPAQVVGPKLLTALGTLFDAPASDEVGMLSPLVARDVLAGGGPALELFAQHSPAPPAALNLCASLTGHNADGAPRDETTMNRLVEVLREG